MQGLRARGFDIALAAGVAVFMQIEVWGEHLHPYGVSVPGTLVQAAAIAWRRRAPLLAAIVVFLPLPIEALLGVHLNEPVYPILLIMLMLYSVAAHADLRRALLGLGIPLVAVWGTFAVEIAHGRRTFGDVAFVTVVAGAPWVIGRAMNGRLHETRRLEVQRVQAVADERARIARELHDVIAHSVSVMVVQAGAAEEVLRRDAVRAAEPLRAVQETGRRALVEMSRLVGLLRENGEEVGLAPQPGLADLGDLVARISGAGLPVALEIDGNPRPLALGADLSAYRVVQEALTNALKHGSGSSATVRLRYLRDTLELEVVNDGAGPARARSGGHGLVGMRERVAVFGGEFAAGPEPDGGFAVRARLPLEAPA